MKKIILLAIVALGFTFVACNGSNDDKTNSASTASVSQATEATNTNVEAQTEAPSQNPVMPNLGVPTADGKQAVKNNDLENPKPARAETPTDRLMKSYNEAFVNMVLDKQAGKEISEEAKKNLAELQSKLGELEKSGKLNETQKQLLKATNDAYNEFMKKQ